MDNSALNFIRKLPATTKHFVDVGANDGVTGSMSYGLEKEGWSGILIEPNPVLVENLKSIRKSEIVNCAVSNSDSKLEFSFVSGPGNLHGLSRFNYTQEFEEVVKKNNGSIEKKIVDCRRLTNILDQSETPKEFAFLKVDVEGHEIEVFKSLDFSKYSPTLIIAEDNTKDLDKRVRQYLKQFDYEVGARIGMNNYFIKRDHMGRFMPSYLKAKVQFLKWDLKRFAWKMVGKEFRSRNV